MIVYHGSDQIVKNPDTLHSYRALDFGKGYYVTTVREQAERWARRKADLTGGKAIVNQYVMKEVSTDLRIKGFLTICRNGLSSYAHVGMGSWNMNSMT